MAKPKESAAIQLTHKKAETPKKNDTKSLTKTAQKVSPVNVKKIELKKVAAKESKPPKDNAKIQTKESSKKGLIVSIDTVKKPEGSNKVQELEAMEEALKKATQEAHN